MTTERIQVGQRVWVADAWANGKKVKGVITSIPEGYLGRGSVIVLLDDKHTAVCCSEEQRGARWDFVAD